MAASICERSLSFERKPMAPKARFLRGGGAFGRGDDEDRHIGLSACSSAMPE
jgi:hypothetical protein